MKRVLTGYLPFASAYLLLAAGFFIIHLTQVKHFSASSGTVSIEGYTSRGTGFYSPEIRRITLSEAMVRIDISQRNKAVLITTDGIRHSLDIVDWKQEESIVHIEFSHGAGISIQTNGDEPGFRLDTIIPETIPPVRSLEIPFELNNNVLVTRSPEQPGVFSLTTDELAYSIKLPESSSWDASSEKIQFVVNGINSSTLENTGWKKRDYLTAIQWLQQNSFPSQDAYQQAVDQWIQRARSNWSTRFNARMTQWDAPMVAAVLADSVQQGHYSASLVTALNTAERFPRQINWLTSPFLGDIVTHSHAHELEIKRGANAAGKEISSMNMLPTPQASLINLVDTNNLSQANKIVLLAQEIQGSSLSNEEVIARLALLHEAGELGLRESRQDVIDQLINVYLLPRIYWINNGLWLVKSDGFINVKLSLMAGALLLNNDVSQRAGQQLIISALAMADEDGNVPGTLKVEGNESFIQSGSIPPEDFYPTVIGFQAYPRHVSLAEELNPGVWAITGAEDFIVTKLNQEIRILLKFPPGGTHHMAIRGIKKIESLYMQGIEWFQDPQFQRNYAGWYYEDATKTCYIKISHRTRTETIRLLYGSGL